MPNIWVFDADDTLWQNEWMYSRANALFMAYLYEELGPFMPNLHDFKDRLFEIDKEKFDQWGIRRGRVTDSMLKTYNDICDWIKHRFGETVYDPSHVSVIADIGDLPFDHSELAWNEGAEDVLKTLKSKGHTVCLLSSYDADEFPKRVELLGLYRYFEPERIRLTQTKKTKDDFAAVSGWDSQNWSACFAVGNGLSDIEPALELANTWSGIYIPHASTSIYLAERGTINHFTPPPAENPRIKTLNDISDLLPLI